MVLKGSKDEIIQSFEKIYNKYYKIVFFVAFSYVQNKECAEDISQDVFCSFFEKALDCEWLSKITNIKAYLCACSKNAGIKESEKRRKIVFLDNVEVIPSADERYSEALLFKILSTLDKESIDLINNHVFLELSFKEISKEVCVPVNTLKSKYRRALQKIRRSLKDDKKIF